MRHALKILKLVMGRSSILDDVVEAVEAVTDAVDVMGRMELAGDALADSHSDPDLVDAWGKAVREYRQIKRRLPELPDLDL